MSVGTTSNMPVHTVFARPLTFSSHLGAAI